MGTDMELSNNVENIGVKKKMAYNVYRDMLKNYNGKANDILETKPAHCFVIEDRGIEDRIENMARQQIMSGAPPPPPLSLGAVPAVRLKSEINESRPEPPACVQNAMMTKDKKPFTYTPGGLDLSQIRSPRMAKRVSRNAQAEGVTGIPQSPMSPGPGGPAGPVLIPVGPGGIPPPPPPPGVGAPMPPPPPSGNIPIAPKPPSTNNNLPPYTRPDIKIPENPMQLLRKTGGPVIRTSPLLGPDEELTKQPVMGPGGQVVAPAPLQQQHRQSPPVQQPVYRQPESPVQQQQQQPVYRPVKPPQQVYQSQQPPTPQPQVYQPPTPQPQVYQPPTPQPQVYQPPTPQPQVYQTPTPQPQVYQQPQPQVYQPPQQQQTQQPAQQPRFESRQQVGTLYIPPLSPEELQQKSPPTRSGPESPGSPMDTLKKAPTPWLQNRGQKRGQEVPSWARSPPESTPSTPGTPQTPQTPGGATRVIPLRVDKEGDMIDMQQQMQQQMQQWQQQQQQAFQQQQQQWRQQQMQQQQQPQMRQQHVQQSHSSSSTQQSQQHVVRVIPIQIEGRTNAGPMSPNNNVSTPDVMDGPVQSPTFRVLQRVTSRDEEIHAQPAVAHPATAAQPFTPPPTDQVRRLQLAEDDQKFMNRVRNQVDEEVFLHSEEDPRYRGAAIPSRAFRMLQNMTDAAEASGDPNCVPRAVLVNRGQPGKKNQPGTPTGEQVNVPPSEQRVPEPKKYTGSAIPSRSFQMLQAMVAPENCANGSDESTYPYDPNYYPYYDPMYSYWDPYWSYYTAPTSDPNTTEETATENNSTAHSEEEYYQQLPYWDPYYYYYYGYYPPPPHTYSPHAFYPSNETDDYSSTDEMCYYGARFPNNPTPCTEVQQINEENTTNTPGLHSIRSVSDIQVYNDTTDEQSSVNEEETTDSDTDSDNTEDCEEEDEEEEDQTEENESHLPHQLSVIFEESEISECDRKKRESSVATTISEEDSSTTIGGNHEESEEGEASCDEDIGETSVTVRLPLKLKFGKEVTEVIVGDSEMEPNTPENSIKSPLTLPPGPLQRQNSEETIDNYETADENETQNSRDNSPVEAEEDDTDFWEEINKNVKSDTEEDKVAEEENDADVSDEEIVTKTEFQETEQQQQVVEEENDADISDEEVVTKTELEDDEEEDSSSSSDEDISEDESNYNLEEDLRSTFTSQFRKLREAGKLSLGTESKEESISVRQRIMAIENNCPSASRSSSAKGCDLSEDDSGVTSDVTDSRQDTDTECNEKMKRRYERAATHSRLFKLLQDACATQTDDEEEEDKDKDKAEREKRRKGLSLMLNNSEPESGICSPSSPSWLARELVQGLLGGQEGNKYRALPLEKLYAVVRKILQEESCAEVEGGETYAAYYSSFGTS